MSTAGHQPGRALQSHPPEKGWLFYVNAILNSIDPTVFPWLYNSLLDRLTRASSEQGARRLGTGPQNGNNGGYLAYQPTLSPKDINNLSTDKNIHPCHCQSWLKINHKHFIYMIKKENIIFPKMDFNVDKWLQREYYASSRRASIARQIKIVISRYFLWAGGFYPALRGYRCLNPCGLYASIVCGTSCLRPNLIPGSCPYKRGETHAHSPWWRQTGLSRSSSPRSTLNEFPS